MFPSRRTWGDSCDGGWPKWRGYGRVRDSSRGVSSRVSYPRVSHLAPCHSRTTQTPEGAKPLCDGSLAAPLAQRGGRNSPINRAGGSHLSPSRSCQKVWLSPRTHVPHTFDSRRRERRGTGPRVTFRAWRTVAARLAGCFVSPGKPSRRIFDICCSRLGAVAEEGRAGDGTCSRGGNGAWSMHCMPQWTHSTWHGARESRQC